MSVELSKPDISPAERTMTNLDLVMLYNMIFDYSRRVLPSFQSELKAVALRKHFQPYAETFEEVKKKLAEECVTEVDGKQVVDEARLNRVVHAFVREPCVIDWPRTVRITEKDLPKADVRRKNDDGEYVDNREGVANFIMVLGDLYTGTLDVA